MQTALVAGIVLAAQKTIQAGPIIDKKTYDYQMLRFLQGGYLIMLVMLILAMLATWTPMILTLATRISKRLPRS